MVQGTFLSEATEALKRWMLTACLGGHFSGDPWTDMSPWKRQSEIRHAWEVAQRSSPPSSHDQLLLPPELIVER